MCQTKVVDLDNHLMAAMRPGHGLWVPWGAPVFTLEAVQQCNRLVGALGQFFGLVQIRKSKSIKS